MSFDLGKLFIEWRRIVPNGVPNPGNDYHLVLLKEVCLANGIDVDTTNNVILALEKKDDEKIKWKNKDGRDRETGLDTIKQYASDIKSGDSSQNKELAVKAANLGDKETGGEEEEIEEKPPMKIAKNPYEKEDDDSENDSEEKPKTKEDLLTKDHDTVEKTLKYTKTQAEKDKESGGREGVGLGTDTSRAGESAVHTGIRMLQDKKSIDKIQDFLMDIANDKDTFLDKKWVGATMSTLNSIQEKIGVENIDDVSWDTPEGREAIGVDTKLETSADMFVRTKEGRNVGISLKQDGSVFLNNGGWAKQSKLLLDKLKEQMPDDEHSQLEEAMSIQNYNQDRAERFIKSASKYKVKEILELANSLSDVERKKEKISDKYMYILRNPKELLERINNKKMSGDDMKAFHRLLKIKDKEGEKYIRESEKAF